MKLTLPGLMKRIHTLRSEGVISGGFKAYNDKRATDRRVKMICVSPDGFTNLVRLLAYRDVDFRIEDGSTLTFTTDHDGTVHQANGRKVA